MLVEEGRRTLLVDGRYKEQALREAQNADVIEYGDKVEGIIEILKQKGMGRIGFESPSMTYAQYMKIRKGLPQELEMVPLERSLLFLRARKDKGEVAFLRRAAAIAALALQKTLAAFKSGMTEREAARLLDWNMIQEGGERPAFDTIIASGPNGALPHARPGSKSLAEGELIVIDYGVLLEGYNSDESVTVALGPPSVEARHVYEIVLEAHDRAIEVIRPGVLCRDVDATARGIIEKAGYGSNFVHGTGHGLGMQVHEAPSVSRKSEDRLEEGMVITVEPGIYLPGRFGVRIEDSVLVTADGHEIISCTSKHMMTL